DPDPVGDREEFLDPLRRRLAGDAAEVAVIVPDADPLLRLREGGQRGGRCEKLAPIHHGTLWIVCQISWEIGAPSADLILNRIICCMTGFSPGISSVTVRPSDETFADLMSTGSRPSFFGLTTEKSGEPYFSEYR